MTRKYRHTFTAKCARGLIEIPKEIRELLPSGKSVSVTIEYAEAACDTKGSNQSHLDALDDVHDSYP